MGGISQQSELLLARICHDLSAPIGAMGMVASTLSGDPEAFRILSESQQRLVARLKLFRLLSIDTDACPEFSFEKVKDVLTECCLCEKVTFLTRDLSGVLETPRIKFLISAAAILLPALVRGGHMVFEAQEGEGRLCCSGQGGRIYLQEEVISWFSGTKTPSSQTIFCSLIESFAQACGGSVRLVQTSEKATLFLDTKTEVL
ncbi:MAG: hypothetical protein LBJ70_03060 [Holosporales bacterium]|jgi:hypothetical protein|nr:hypothetical protein [Holosporales bacterium]